VVGLEPAKWESFALGQLGASAALLGLVFVGISINLQNVLSSRRLVDRAAEAVLLLASILLGSTAVLLPEQSARTLGVELAVLGAVLLVGVLVFQRSLHLPVAAADAAEGETGDANEPRVAHFVRRLLGVGASGLVLVAAGCLIGDVDGALYWWAGAIVLAYVGALTSAWVLLIEILR
jgi:hypothetical protein